MKLKYHLRGLGIGFILTTIMLMISNLFVNNNNGKIFVGAAFPTTVKEAKSLLFPEKEKNELRGGADGHVLAISDYEPGSEYVYYWGAAWDKADIKTPEAWNEYMANYAQKVRNPLTVTIK